MLLWAQRICVEISEYRRGLHELGGYAQWLGGVRSFAIDFPLIYYAYMYRDGGKYQESHLGASAHFIRIEYC